MHIDLQHSIWQETTLAEIESIEKLSAHALLQQEQKSTVPNLLGLTRGSDLWPGLGTLADCDFDGGHS